VIPEEIRVVMGVLIGVVMGVMINMRKIFMFFLIKKVKFQMFVLLFKRNY